MMMKEKYKTGSIVEVFVSHSWRCAKILSLPNINDLYYTVCYDVYPGFTNKDDVEHVSLESIRPCPPLLEISKSWVCGDPVEVFHHLSWKLATVLKDCRCDEFLVRLIGSLEEFEVSRSEIRASYKYEDGEWVEVDATIPRVFNRAAKKVFECDQDLGFRGKKGNNTKKSLKRCCYSEDEERPQKFRVIEKEGRPEKVEGNETHSVMSSSGSNRYYNPNEVYESDAESVCWLGDYEDSTDESLTNEALAHEIHG